MRRVRGSVVSDGVARGEAFVISTGEVHVRRGKIAQGHEEREVQRLERALTAMDELPPRQREVLHLHACEQLELAEIAEVLAISSDAVKASLSMARKRMRSRLSDLLTDTSARRTRIAP